MHGNLTAKERQVIITALECQKDEYLENADGHNGLKEGVKLLENLIDKLSGDSQNSKDVLHKTDTQTTVGFTLDESQCMYVALYSVRANFIQMLAAKDAGIWPQDAPIQASDIEEHIQILTKYIEKLENSFHAAGINIDDFFTIHENEESYYKATGHRIKGAERNSPCPCGSGKKYKNCCGKN